MTPRIPAVLIALAIGASPLSAYAQAKQQAVRHGKIQLTQVPDRDDPAFDAAFARLVRALGDANPRTRNSATTLLSHANPITTSDLIDLIEAESRLEVRWRLLEAARMRFERSERAALGVRFGRLNELTVIQETIAGFACNDQGLLQPGDVLLSIGGVNVRTDTEGSQSTTMLSRIQPAIICHDPGDVVEFVVSRISAEDHVIKDSDFSDLRRPTNEVPLNESALPREAISLQIPLGAFSELNPNTTRIRHNSTVMLAAWELRSEMEGLAPTSNALPRSIEPTDQSDLRGLVENVARVVGELRSMFPNASEMPNTIMPEALPDDRLEHHERVRAAARAAPRPRVPLRIRAQQIRVEQQMNLEHDFDGMPTFSAFNTRAQNDQSQNDPQLNTLIKRVATLQQSLADLYTKHADSPVESPSRTLLEQRLLSTRKALAAAKTELGILSQRASDQDSSGVRYSGSSNGTANSDS